MATFTVIARQRLDNYAVVSTLTSTAIEPGQSVTLAGLGDGLDGAQTILATPQYAFIGTDGDTGELLYDVLVPRENQLLFYDAGDDIDWAVIQPTGTCLWDPTCTWILGQDIEDYLGIPTTSAGDAAFLDQCAAAANAFAYRRRSEAGWLQDSLSTPPSADVTLATIMIGAAYFRQRSSYSTLASFEQLGAPPVSGVTPMIMQLLGVNRPQVA
jgi:hypothetical protein